MTVRAWFTISAIAVVALVAAFVWRFFFAAVAVPEVIARSDDVRLPGVFLASCWPDRDEELTCEEAEGVEAPQEQPAVDAAGSFRLIVAFPARPEGGRIEVSERGRTVIESEWTSELDYDLDPGSYELTAEARYRAGAFVRYRFAFSVD